MPRSDAEIIADHEAAIARGKELEGFRPIPGRVSPNLTFGTSVRFAPEEYTRYYEAARSRGMTLSAFLRAAAAAALAGETDIEKAAAIQEARQKADELQAALARAGD
jgi:hypothetical protein